QADLAKVVRALHPLRCIASRLHGRQQQRNQNADNEDRNQYFHERERGTAHQLSPPGNREFLDSITSQVIAKQRELAGSRILGRGRAHWLLAQFRASPQWLAFMSRQMAPCESRCRIPPGRPLECWLSRGR